MVCNEIADRSTDHKDLSRNYSSHHYLYSSVETASDYSQDQQARYVTELALSEWIVLNQEALRQSKTTSSWQ